MPNGQRPERRQGGGDRELRYPPLPVPVPARLPGCTLRPYDGPRPPDRTGGRPCTGEAISLLTLDLHPIFRNDRDIDLALRQALFKAAATGVDVVEVIPGKGTGRLRNRVLAVLSQKHIRKLYARVETDPANTGRILVHLR